MELGFVELWSGEFGDGERYEMLKEAATVELG